jgi:hypothetical protein
VQLKAEAKQALLRRNFGMARSILDEAIEMQPSSYKVRLCSTWCRTLPRAPLNTRFVPLSLLQLHRLRSVASACLGDYEAALGMPCAGRCVSMQRGSDPPLKNGCQSSI